MPVNPWSQRQTPNWISYTPCFEQDCGHTLKRQCINFSNFNQRFAYGEALEVYPCVASVWAATYLDSFIPTLTAVWTASYLNTILLLAAVWTASYLNTILLLATVLTASYLNTILWLATVLTASYLNTILLLAAVPSPSLIAVALSVDACTATRAAGIRTVH